MEAARQVTAQILQEEASNLTTGQLGALLRRTCISADPRSAAKRDREGPDVFLGCRMPASACNLDHRQPWAEGGATAVGNLEPLCRHHHRIRHEAGWGVRRLDNGDHLWTSPLGRTDTTSGASP